jgi:hypothetical protein
VKAPRSGRPSQPISKGAGTWPLSETPRPAAIHDVQVDQAALRDRQEELENFLDTVPAVVVFTEGDVQHI